MPTIKNSWVEKIKKKKEKETAPAFESVDVDSYKPDKPIACHTNAARATYKQTLRGVRK